MTEPETNMQNCHITVVFQVKKRQVYSIWTWNFTHSSTLISARVDGSTGVQRHSQLAYWLVGTESNLRIDFSTPNFIHRRCGTINVQIGQSD